MTTTPTIRLNRITENLLDWISLISEELKDCIDHSENYVTVDSVATAVLTGQMVLFIAEYKGGYAGFVIAEEIDTARGKYLNLPFAHSNPSLWGEIDVMKTALGQLEEMARQAGMVGVFLTSSRKGYARRVKPMGYEPDIFRWVKEL